MGIFCKELQGGREKRWGKGGRVEVTRCRIGVMEEKSPNCSLCVLAWQGRADVPFWVEGVSQSRNSSCFGWRHRGLGFGRWWDGGGYGIGGAGCRWLGKLGLKI